MHDIAQLTPYDLLVERPFTDPDHVAADSAVLQTMAKQAWQTAEQARPPANTDSVPTFHFPHPDAWQKRTMLLDLPAMHTATQLTIVGFFGNKRSNIAPTVETDVFEAGQKLCAALRDHPSIVCYVTNLLADTQNYANLVVMKSVQTIEEWRTGELHQRVAESTSPQYYKNVRIYSGSLSVFSPGGHAPRHFTVNLQKVKYFDYVEPSTWYGVRLLEQGLLEQDLLEQGPLEPLQEAQPEYML